MTGDAFSQTDLRWRFAVTCTREAGVPVIAPQGRIGHSLVPRLTAVLAEAVADGDRHVVVDLSGVDYVSSAAVLALDALASRLLAGGGSVVLCGLNEPVRYVCELAGLLPRVTVKEGRINALDACR